MKILNIILLLTSVILFSQPCYAESLAVHNEVNTEFESIFNKNVESIRQLVVQQEQDGIVKWIDSSHVATVLKFQNSESDVIFYKITDQRSTYYPALSINPDNGDYFWVIANEYILDRDGNKIKVNDNSKVPYFNYTDGQWLCTIDNIAILVENCQLTNKLTSISIADDAFVVFTFPSSYQISLPLASFSPPMVPLQSFYKDVFLDAGIGLTSRKSLHAAKYLGLTTEGVSLPRSGATTEDVYLQNAIFAGNDDDMNGRLLFPDGQPRYRLLFVNGGNSREHGMSISEEARNCMKKFVQNGGSYVGTCAGAFLASNGYDLMNDYPYYLSIWPSTMNHTGISNERTGMFIETDSPLLKYYDYGGDNYVEDIRHNKGGYPISLPTPTEVLARFDYPSNSEIHMKPSIWSYKENNYTGRVVMESSHPEEVSSGERRDLTAAMMLYAIDGIGKTKIKGFLQNGLSRVMNCDTDDNLPSKTKIGDLQCHHFAVYLPEDANNMTVTLSSELQSEMVLMMSKNTFAYPDDAEYISTDEGGGHQLSFDSIRSGIWFIAVKCLTNVNVEETEYGQSYIGHTDVLNGVPYTIQVSWDVVKSDYPGETGIETTPVNASAYNVSQKGKLVGISGMHTTGRHRGIYIKINGDKRLKVIK